MREEKRVEGRRKVSGRENKGTHNRNKKEERNDEVTRMKNDG